jgi:UDP-3-O-[3-hydroxymyristoyl] glucosamine N-acyltransferase
MRQYTVEDIKRLIGDGISVIGNPEGRFFTQARPVLEAEPSTLVWISPAREDKEELAQQTRAGIVICDPTLPISDELAKKKCFVVVDKPKLVFLRVVEACFSEQSEYGIHDTAWVRPEAEIHPGSYIGPFTYVGISIIGEGTVIHGHCHIYDKVHIGNNVTVHAGTVIGSEGFGYERNDEGKLERFPHIGGVVIEDNVDIGANTCIDRGTLGDTIIRKGAKIDNLVHIAHNIVVGRDAAVIANAMVGGSVNIGDKAWLAPSATVMDRISIGRNALIGLGAVVLHDVPDNAIVVGNPAKELKRKT